MLWFSGKRDFVFFFLHLGLVFSLHVCYFAVPHVFTGLAKYSMSFKN
jgi:hypothetical protein